MHGYSCNCLSIKLQTSAWQACNFFVNNYFLVRPQSDVKNTPVSLLLTLSDSDTFWRFLILAQSDFDTIWFWHFLIPTLSDSDPFQFLHFPVIHSGVSLKGRISHPTMLALWLSCSTAVLTTPWKALSTQELVELKIEWLHGENGICQNWKLSESVVCHSLKKLEIVRIGKCQNWNLSELESIIKRAK